MSDSTVVYYFMWKALKDTSKWEICYGVPESDPDALLKLHEEASKWRNQAYQIKTKRLITLFIGDINI